MYDSLNRLGERDAGLNEEAANNSSGADPGLANDGAFGSLVRHASDIIMVLGADGAIRYVSPASERWLGYEPVELVGENAFGHLHPDDRERAGVAFDGLLRDAGSNPPIELRMRHKDGSWRIFEMMGANLLGDPGVRGVVVNVRDVTERKRAEEKLWEAEARYRTLVEHIPAIVYTLEPGPGTDPPYPVSYMGPRAEEMLGYPPRAFVEDPDLRGRILHPDDRERVLAEDRRAEETGEPFRAEYRVIHRDGRVVWVRDEAVLIREEGGRPLYRQGIMSDISGHKRIEEDLARLASFPGLNPNPVIETDPTGAPTYSNPAAARLFPDLPALGAEHPVLANLGSAAGELGDFEERSAVREVEVGGAFYQQSITPVPGCKGVRRLYMMDVTERKVLERELAHQALHDPLTGLPNRRLFEDRLDHALARVERHDGLVAILYLDLDDFKVVNDSWGHEAGDRLLIEVARRLASCLRDADTAARLGGDEFAVLLEDTADEGAAARTAARILKALETPFELEGREVRVSASIGIASSGGESGGELLRKADQAMYRAKEAGKNRHEAFDRDAG